MTRKQPLVCVLLGFLLISLVGPSGTAVGASERAGRSQPASQETSASSSSRNDDGRGAAARRVKTRGSDQREHESPLRTPDQVRVEEVGIPEAPVGRPAKDRSIVQRTLDTGQVALTFDDGPDAATPTILAVLRKSGVKATFCVIGSSVQAHPDLVRQIVAEGHSLCNHTWRHDLHLGTRGVPAIREDLQRTADEIHKAVPGAPIRYFRHPGGNFTAASAAVTKELGMISLGWDIDPNDWNLAKYPAAPARTDHVVGVVTSQCHPGAIILSHDGGGDRNATVTAYQRLLPWLKERFDLVALPS